MVIEAICVLAQEMGAQQREKGMLGEYLVNAVAMLGRTLEKLPATEAERWAPGFGVDESEEHTG